MNILELTPDELREGLKGDKKKNLYELASELSMLEKKLNLTGPQTDDELHKWILDTFKINIPRVAVCEGHNSQFEFLADLYFGRSKAALALGSRGSSKTFLVAMLHRLNAEFKVGVEGLTVGSNIMQATRCFNHLEKLINMRGENSILSKMKTEIVWKNGCKVEIVPSSMGAVNGPHPHIMHVDEVELVDSDVFNESRNCAQSGKVNGVLISAQDILTSTRKRAIGPMQSLLNQINESKQRGDKPPYDLYTFCVFEAAQPNKNCQVANPNTAKPCECDKISNGEWNDTSVRYLKDVCNGKFAKSDGWIVWEDVVRLFTNNPRDMWEAQQECSKPETSDIVLPQFSIEKNGIIDYHPDPANGPIYQGIDFGSTNPNAVLWWQVLKFDLEVTNINGHSIVIKEGSRVCFDEFYKSEIPNYELARNIIRKEKLWKDIYPDFRVKGRFADPQGAQSRRDLANHEPKILTTWHTSRDVRDQIKVVKELIENKKFYIDIRKVPMLIEELGYWHYPKQKSGIVYDDPEIPVDDFDHSCSAMRYCLCNVKILEDGGKEKGIPSSTGSRQDSAKRLTDLRDRLPGRSSKIPNTEKWRLGLGGPYSSDTRGNF